MESLEIISGRVLLSFSQRLTVEFGPKTLPNAGDVLLGPSGAIMEVLRKTSPSEVLAVLRHGPAPAKGAVLTKTGRCLELPCLSALWGQSISPSGAGGFPDEPLVDGLVLGKVVRKPQALRVDNKKWGLGHAGIDLLAPLFDGSSLAITSTAGAPERLMNVHLPWMARMTQARVLWVSGKADGGKPESLEPESTIHIKGSDQPGEAALLLRSAVAIAEAVTEAGHPLLVVLDDPLDAIIAWRQCDGMGVSSGQMAIRHYEDAINCLAGPGRALVAYLPSDSVRLGLIAAGHYEPASALASIAPFEGTRFLSTEATSRWRKDLPAPQGQLAQRCLDSILTDNALSDHAAIFGEEELDVGQRECLETHRSVASWLETMPDKPLSLNEVLTLGEQWL